MSVINVHCFKKVTSVKEDGTERGLSCIVLVTPTFHIDLWGWAPEEIKPLITCDGKVSQLQNDYTLEHSNEFYVYNNDNPYVHPGWEESFEIKDGKCIFTGMFHSYTVRAPVSAELPLDEVRAFFKVYVKTYELRSLHKRLDDLKQSITESFKDSPIPVKLVLN